MSGVSSDVLEVLGSILRLRPTAFRAVRYPNQVEGLVSATKRIDPLNDSCVTAQGCFLCDQSELLLINGLGHCASPAETSGHDGERKWRLGKGVNISKGVISETRRGKGKLNKKYTSAEHLTMIVKRRCGYHGQRLPLDQKIR